MIISVLIAINIGCLLFILLNRPERHNRKFDAMIVESLQLNDEQVARFDDLKRQHHRQMLQIDRRMQAPFEQYFGLLTGNRQPQMEDSLKNVLGELYKEKVGITYSHFAEIKVMCSPEQQQNMDKVVPFLMQVISPPKKDIPGRGK